MPRKQSRENWEPWSKDPKVEFSESDGGLEIRYWDGDGFRKSGWMLLMGRDVDATVRQHLFEMGRQRDSNSATKERMP